MKADREIPSDQEEGRAAPDGVEFGSDELRSLLISDIHPMRQKMELPLVEALEAEMQTALSEKTDPLGAASALLSAWIEARLDRIAELHRISEIFGARVGRAPDLETRNQHILDFARALGANERQLKGDARAFARWFGLDAVAERYRK
ncbi:MAG: hypothetical protein H0T41_08155, partial [Rhodobacteraceae bacterium]|nr:hypothetical protein [Paracoccaceae bacterium]